MDLTAALEASCPPDELFSWVDDLSRYPSWLEIVTATEPAPPVASDVGPAWFVTLRGRVGPLARSKRLRMQRTVHEPPEPGAPGRVSFERAETDGRDHSPWRLDSAVSGDGATSTLHMELHYGGSLWAPVLDRVLGSEIEASRARLRDLVGG